MNTCKTKKLKPLWGFSRLQMTLASFFFYLVKGTTLTLCLVGWKGRGNVILHCLVGVKKGEGIKWGRLSFSPFPTIYFPSKLGRKEERKWSWEGSKKLPILYHPSTFNNKYIIVIYSLYSNFFSSLPNMHCTKLKYIVFFHFSILPIFHSLNQPKPQSLNEAVICRQS